MWGCAAHWFRLPKRLRDRIWATYRPGQEITKTPSADYLEAAREVREWVQANSEAKDLSESQRRLDLHS